MNFEEVLTSRHADLLVKRIAQASGQAENKIKELGVTFDRSNPKQAILDLIEPLNAVPPADRYKVELLIFGQKCISFWFVLFDAMRAKAPKDIIEGVTEVVAAAAEVVDAAVDLATPDVVEPAKETAAAVKAKSKK